MNAPDSTMLLPVVTALADLRREADHRSELLSQTPHGHLVRVAESSRDRRWRRALSPDGLRGWIRTWSLGDPTDARRALGAAGLVVTAPWTVFRPLRGEARRLPLGARVLLAPTRGVSSRSERRVALANGARGTLAESDLAPEPAHAASLFVAAEHFLEPDRLSEPDWKWVCSQVTPRPILATIRSLLGAPYLWGGTSPGGLDCSGLMRVAFLVHGVPLPRDTEEQARSLRPYELPVRACRAGDLLFFGGTDAVSHVAMAESEHCFVHASGEVRRSRIDRPSERDRDLLESWILTVRPPYGARRSAQRQYR